MSDNDLIRRGDALSAIQLGDTVAKMQARIAAIPYVAADPVCTGCGGAGITYQTERRCACQGPDLSDPVVVHLNMLRGTIAKPTIEQIVHLYGSEAFQPMIDAARQDAKEAETYAWKLEEELRDTQDRANAFATKEYYTEMRAERAEAKLAKALAEAREKVLREAADALRGQGYYTADSAILALIEKPITQGGKGE